MAKSKEQKRKEADERNAKAIAAREFWRIRNSIPEEKPLLCGGYTQHDWELLTWWYYDPERFDEMWERCETLEEQHDTLRMDLLSTKPCWA